MQITNTNRSRRDILILGLICLVLQLAVSPLIGIASGHANFAFIFSAIVALSIGGTTGVIYGFIAGLLFDLGATSPIGLMALLLTVSSYFLGTECRNRISDDPRNAFACCTLAAFVVSLLYSLAMPLVGQADSFVDIFVMRALPSFFLTWLFSIPFCLYYARSEGQGRSPSGGLKLGIDSAPLSTKDLSRARHYVFRKR